MSKEIDEKVVSMKFDNKDFMDKTEQTMTRLDKLKASLRLEDTTKGFTDLNKAAGTVDLNQVGTAAEQVGIKFNALQVMATTALMNITNSAVNAGKQIVSALTIEPVKAGFNEYELKMTSVNTIMNSTGESIETVNEYLEELNKYSDQTIYSFSDMTSNIGKFTNAGVKLEDAVAAIKGISNEAAVSGANANEASRAMYNFAQALSAGYVKLIDWKSIENANMATVEFKQQLIDTALALGVVEDAGDGMYETLEGTLFNATENFNDTLQDQWMTSEVLINTLKKYSDETTEIGAKATEAATKVRTFSMLLDTLKESAQSGWAQTWEILFGDLNEATELWTGISEVIGGIIGDAAAARNALLEGWKNGGGRQAIIDSFVNVWKALLAIVGPVKDAFREIFPPASAEQLIRISESLRDLTANLILSEDAQKGLKSTFKGLFAVLDIGVHIIKEVAKGAWTVFSELIKVVVSLAGGVNIATGTFGDWLVRLRDTVKSSTLLTSTINGIVMVLLKVVEGLKLVVNYIKESEILTNIVNGLAYTFSKLGQIIKTVYTYLSEHIKFPGIETFLTILTAIWTGIKYVFGKIKETVGEAGSAFMEAFRAGDFKKALEIFNTGIVAGILLGIKKFTDGFGAFKGGVKSIVKSVTGILDSVRDCFEAYQQRIQAATLMEIAKAIAILVASIVVLTLIKREKLEEALTTLVFLFAGLLGTMAIASKVSGNLGSIYKMTSTMVAMSIAVLILASALKKLAKIDIQQMGTAFLALGGLAAIVIMFTKTVGKSLNANKKTAIIKYSTSLLALAVGVKVLASACEQLGSMNLPQLIKGLAAVAAFMAGFSLFIKKTSMTKQMHETMKGILLMSISIGILAGVVALFGRMSWEGLLKGLAGVAALMLGLAAAMKLMPQQTTLKLVGTLLALSAALVIMSGVMMVFSLMSWDGITKGLVAVGGALLLLSASMLIMKSAVSGAAAMILAAVALNLIAIPLQILGAMSLASIGIALLALAGTFVVFGLAGLLLTPIVPVLLAFGAAVLMMGVGLLGVCVGMYAFASALLVLGAAGPAAATGLVAAIGIILAGIVGLVGVLGTALLSAITALCTALIKAAPVILEALGVILDGLLVFILKYAPKIIAVVLELIVALLQAIDGQAGNIIQAAVGIVVNLIRGLGSRVGDLIAAAFDLILQLINGISDAIETYMPLLFDACIHLGESIMQGIGYGIGASTGYIWTMIKSVGQGIIDGFKKTLGINSPSKEMIPIGQGIDEGMVVGIEKYQGLVTDATEDVGKTAVESMSNAISGISDVIDADIDSQPTIRPVLDLSDIESGANSINKMFGMTPSVDVMSNVGSISSMMNSNSQNGGNFDIISAIKDLGAKISDMSGNSYVINGITYDDGSNVADAVESIIRAARIERRI